MPQGSEWIEIIAQSLTILTVLGSVLYAAFIKPLSSNLEQHKREQGERIGKVEGSCAGNQREIGTLSERLAQSQLDREGLHKDVGRLEGIVEQMGKAAAARDEKMFHEIHAVALDVRELKTKIDIFEGAKNDILEFVRAVAKANAKGGS